MDQELIKLSENIKAIGNTSESLCESSVNKAHVYCTLVMPFSELVVRNVKEFFEKFEYFEDYELVEKAKQNDQVCKHTLEIHEYLLTDFKNALILWNDQHKHCEEEKEKFKRKHDRKAFLAVGTAVIPYVNFVAAPTIGWFAYKDKKAAAKANEQAERAVSAATDLGNYLIAPIEKFINAMIEISRFFEIIDNIFLFRHNSEEINKGDVVKSCSSAEKIFFNYKNHQKISDNNNEHVQQLLTRQYANKNGWSLLHIAAAAGCLEVVKTLQKE
ncbi:557_t:CDS:1, partial [Dentiscutata heterogama]